MCSTGTRREGTTETEIGIGQVGQTCELDGDVRVWIGEADDPFWLDAVSAKTFLDATLAGAAWTPNSFSSGAITTAQTNVALWIWV